MPGLHNSEPNFFGRRTLVNIYAVALRALDVSLSTGASEAALCVGASGVQTTDQSAATDTFIFIHAKEWLVGRIYVAFRASARVARVLIAASGAGRA